MTPENQAELIVSTAHKAKGREWPVVMIDPGFVEVEESPAELRLRYVAFTRAREHLDATAFDVADDEEQPELPGVATG